MGLTHSTVADWTGRNSKVMRLHILSGSFVDAGGGGCPAMDASVWSRLPDDMLWRVLGFVPAAKLFQWHTVSRKWRRVLTPRHFHNTIAAAAAAQERQRGVVACVTQLGEVSMRRMRSSRAKAMRVVDVDLTSFVPTWFWTRHQDGCLYASFSVVAAGNGLVCICNNLWCDCVCSHLLSCVCDRAAAQGTRYCVLNPLTRTCVVLPPASFLPPANHELLPLRCSLELVSSEGAPAAAALTLSKWDDQGCDARRSEKRMEAATCDLQAGARCITLHKSVVPTSTAQQQATRWPRCPPALAQCGGETFFYHAGRVHVLQLAAPLTGAGTATLTSSEEEAQGTKRRRGRLDEAGGTASTAVATFDGPSVASLGLDAAAIGYEDDVFLVVHRGAIFLVAQLLRRPARRGGNYTLDPDLVAGVWRLDRRRRAWEPVSRLDAQQARRLVASAPVQPLRRASVVVCNASVAGLAGLPVLHD